MVFADGRAGYGRGKIRTEVPSFLVSVPFHDIALQDGPRNQASIIKEREREIKAQNALQVTIAQHGVGYSRSPTGLKGGEERGRGADMAEDWGPGVFPFRFPIRCCSCTYSWPAYNASNARRHSRVQCIRSSDLLSSPIRSASVKATKHSLYPSLHSPLYLSLHFGSVPRFTVPCLRILSPHCLGRPP